MEMLDFFFFLPSEVKYWHNIRIYLGARGPYSLSQDKTEEYEWFDRRDIPQHTHIFRDEVASHLDVSFCNDPSIGRNNRVQSGNQMIDDLFKVEGRKWHVFRQ